MASTNPATPPAGDNTIKTANTTMEATTAKTATATTMKNPFVGKDFSGFEDPKITVARRREQKRTATAVYNVPAEAAMAVYNKGGDYEPLKPGESLWDPGFSSIRRNNIIGGWVAKSTS